MKCLSIFDEMLYKGLNMESLKKCERKLKLKNPARIMMIITIIIKRIYVASNKNLDCERYIKKM